MGHFRLTGLMRQWVWLGVLFLMLLLLVWGSSGLWIPKLVQRATQQWIVEHHQRLSVGSVTVTLDPLRLHVGQVRLYEPDGQTLEMGVGSLDMSVSWRSLLHAMPTLDVVSVNQPFVHLVRDSTGHWNVAKLNHSSAGGALPLWVENIRVVGGEVLLEDRVTGQHHALHRLELMLPLLSTHQADREHWVDVHLTGWLDQSPLHLVAQFQPWAKQWKVRGQLNWDHVAVESWLLGLLPRGEQVTGLVDLNLDFAAQQDQEHSMLGAVKHLHITTPELHLLAAGYDLTAQHGRLAMDDFTWAGWQGNWARLDLTGDRLRMAAAPFFDGQSSELLQLSRGWSLAITQGRVLFGREVPLHWQAASVAMNAQAFHESVANSREKIPPLTLEKIQGKIKDLDWPWVRGHSSAVALQANLGREGRFSAAGPVDFAAGVGHLNTGATGLPLALAQPYLATYADVLINRGQLAWQGQWILGEGQPWHGHYRGSVQARDLVLRDIRRAQLLWHSNTLTLKGLDLTIQPFSLALEQLAIRDFYARVMLLHDGTLNLKSLWRHSTGGSAVTDRARPSAAVSSPSNRAAVLPVTLRQVMLQGGRVHYKDDFVSPAFEVDVSQLGGAVMGLSSRQQALAQVDWYGQVNGAPLHIQGQINPLASIMNMNLKAHVVGMDLPLFSPYSDKYVGYDIRRGKLTLDLTYQIEDGHLRAENHLILNQLTFGKPVASESATHLPVELAVSLLKDSQGNINMDLPIEGSLNDPRFSVGEALAKMMLHVIEHALESPFVLLKNWIEPNSQPSASPLRR